MDDQTRQRIRYLRTPDGVKLAWAEAGTGPLLIKAAQLAQPPRVRLGEPGLAALDPVLRRPHPPRPLRRARLRDDRLERRRSVLLRAGSTISSRWSPRRRREGRSRCSASRKGRRSCVAYAASAPRARVARSSSTAATRAAGRCRDDPGGKREYEAIIELTAPRLGQGQSRLPRGVHLALHPGRDAGADRLVQRALPQDHHAGRSPPQLLRCAGTRRRHERCSSKVRAPTLVLHARDDAVVPLSPGPPPRRQHPRRRVRRAGLEEPHPARGRAGLGALLRRRPRVHGLGRARLPPPRTPPSPRSPRASAESSPSSPRGSSNADIAERLVAQREDGAQPHLEPLRQARASGRRAQAMVFARDRGFRG